MKISPTGNMSIRLDVEVRLISENYRVWNKFEKIAVQAVGRSSLQNVDHIADVIILDATK